LLKLVVLVVLGVLVVLVLGVLVWVLGVEQRPCLGM
jgi:uncharacterized membrane protein affecting hemolysin expression